MISRPGDTPQFFSYAVHYALTSSKISADDWPDSVKDFDPNSIQIPAYQRKIVWKKKEVEEFLKSKSVLLGTVILASGSDNTGIILLDGLQRFAIATALLKCLYPLVLSPEPKLQDICNEFKLLKAEVSSKQPIFEHNDKMLREHTRYGISTSYNELYSEVVNFVESELQSTPKEFASRVTKTFVTKQIAIDRYFGFKNRRELTNTFININSTGIILSEVDLLRSEIVQQADAMQWTGEDIDEMENRFTDIFQSKRIKGTKVLGKNLYDVLSNNESEDNQSKVFQNWHALKQLDVYDLLDFIEDFHNRSEMENENNVGHKKYPFLYEITQCGDLPFSLALWYFYKHTYLKGKQPDFLDGSFDTEPEQHVLLRALYRRMIDGTIGRIGPIVADCIQRDSVTMRYLADQISKDTGASDLDSPPAEDWLKLSLRRVGRNAIRRIFNACLLPDRTNAGGKFDPVEYGTRQHHWNLDHLIPKANRASSTIEDEEMDQITNLAPLPSNLNMQAKNYPCERKLKPQEIYSTVTDRHPYLKWLVNNHYAKYSDATKIDDKHPLNLAKLLVVNSDPPIGDERIDKICDLLRNKI